MLEVFRKDRAFLAIPFTLVLVLLSGLFVGALALTFLVVSAITSLGGDQDDGVETKLPPPERMCVSADLRLRANLGAQGAAEGLLSLTAAEADTACILRASFVIELEDVARNKLPGAGVTVDADYGVVIRAGALGFDGSAASLLFTWANWCGEAPRGTLSAAVTLADGSTIRAPVDASVAPDGAALVPSCQDRDSGSTLDVGDGLRGEIVAEARTSCRAEQIRVNRDLFSLQDDDDDGPRVEGGGFIRNTDRVPCLMPHLTSFRLEDAAGRILKTTTEIERRGQSVPTLVGPVNLRVLFRWWRWCDRAVPGPLYIEVALDDGAGDLKWDLPFSTATNGAAITPPCKDDSKLEVETWFAP
jgi:hypothetical protein